MLSAMEANMLAESSVERQRSFSRLAKFVENQIKAFALGGNSDVEIDLGWAMHESGSQDLLQLGPEKALARILSSAGDDVEVIRYTQVDPLSHMRPAKLHIFWFNKDKDIKKGAVVDMTHSF